jgi:hypothetical protein
MLRWSRRRQAKLLRWQNCQWPSKSPHKPYLVALLPPSESPVAMRGVSGVSFAFTSTLLAPRRVHSSPISKSVISNSRVLSSRERMP